MSYKKLVNGLVNQQYFCVFLLILQMSDFGSLQLTRDLACTEFDCSNKGRCLGTKSTAICLCDSGFVGNRCESKVCNGSAVCSGNGLCVGTTNNHTCICNVGFSGQKCEKTVNIGIPVSSKGDLPSWGPSSLNTCSSADCNNKGVCIGTSVNPTCICYLGYAGQRCESNVINAVNAGPHHTMHTLKGDAYRLAHNACSPMDCNNQGICFGSKDEFNCVCNLGYSGKRCEKTSYPLCDPTDCNNHGLCVGSKKAFTCACHLGYIGERCEKAVGTLCDSSDCNNQGICMGTKNTFTCLCNLGYSGRRCESRMGGIEGLPNSANGLCELKDCNQNGVCIGTKAAPVCLCNLGFSGQRCEIEPRCISKEQCSANGVCYGTQNKFVCMCNIGWSGINCQHFVGS